MKGLSKKSTGIVAIVAGVLAVAALGAVIGTNSRVSKLETTETLSGSAYSIGLLDDTTGKLPTDSEDRDNSGLSTDKYYNYDGLKIEMAKDAAVKYQLNYYDSDKKFLSVQTWTYDFSAAEVSASGVKYVKIEIIPTDDDDGVVSFFEKSTYADMLEVTVKK